MTINNDKQKDSDNQTSFEQQVIKFIMPLLELIYKYIPDPKDRRNFAIELRERLKSNE